MTKVIACTRTSANMFILKRSAKKAFAKEKNVLEDIQNLADTNNIVDVEVIVYICMQSPEILMKVK